MPPRFGHRKSRNGCQRCKARKVKCDEERPICGSCRVHRVPCQYGPPGTGTPPSCLLHRERTPASSPAQITTPYLLSEGDEDKVHSAESSLLELRLLHHFITVVAYTFPSSSTFKRDLWTVDAIRIGFDHSFLLNAIFAVAALHLASHEPGAGRFFTTDAEDVPLPRMSNVPIAPHDMTACEQAHRRYLNLAIQQQRKALANVTSDNAYALFLSSVLLCYQALKLLPEDWRTTTYTPPTHWLRMTKAVTAVVNEATTCLPPDSLLRTIYTVDGEPDFSDKSMIFAPENRKPFESLLDFSKYPEPDEDSQTRQIYEGAVEYVGWFYLSLKKGILPRTVFRYLICLPVCVEEPFFAFVEQRRPRALAILAHHFVMAKLIDDHWMIRGAAAREVHGIQGLLPPDWQWAMQWPLSFLENGDMS